MRTRSATFDEYVLAAFEACEREWHIPPHSIQIGVEDVPPSEPTAWEDAIVLGRSFSPFGPDPARLIIYRLPITTRARTPIEQMTLIHHVVRQQLAELLGRNLDDEDLR